MDVVVPVRRGDLEVKVRLRTVAKPDEDVAVLLSHLGLRLPSRSKTVQNVVEKTADVLRKALKINKTFRLTAELGRTENNANKQTPTFRKVTSHSSRENWCTEIFERRSSP